MTTETPNKPGARRTNKSAATEKTTAKARPKAQHEAEAKPKSTSSRASLASGAATADQVLAQLADGGQNAINSVRRFIDQLDESITGDIGGHSRGHDVIDSALEMSDRLVGAGSDAIRGIVRSF